MKIKPETKQPATYLRKLLKQNEGNVAATARDIKMSTAAVTKALKANKVTPSMNTKIKASLAGHPVEPSKYSGAKKKDASQNVRKVHGGVHMIASMVLVPKDNHEAFKIVCRSLGGRPFKLEA